MKIGKRARHSNEIAKIKAKHIIKSTNILNTPGKTQPPRSKNYNTRVTHGRESIFETSIEKDDEREREKNEKEPKNRHGMVVSPAGFIGLFDMKAFNLETLRAR